MDAIEALVTRNSNGKLCEPAPSQEQLDTFLKAAFSVVLYFSCCSSPSWQLLFWA